MKLFPMQPDRHDGEIDAPSLPWEVAEAIYTHMYAQLHGSGQSLERLAERGGFSFGEIRVMADHLKRERNRR